MTVESSDELEPEAQQPPAGASGISMVVGIGASAGGIKALSQFFAHVPPRTPIAYVVILHLSPDHESKLAEVLQLSASMPVLQVRQTTKLEPAHVYVVPPNQTLEVSDGTLRLFPMRSVEERRAPVDMFFRTLADAYGARATAVVLSGTGPNGSSGLKRIKEHGGLTIAQHTDEAEYGDMPRNSIATGLVDYVLPVADIPGRILAYHERLEHARADILVGDPFGVEPDRGTTTVETLRAAQDWREVLRVLRQHTGQDLSSYKAPTLRRRVERRLNVRGLTTLAEYVRLLREDPEEPAALMRELLISVTSFFRDREAFAALENRVIPLLFERKRGGDQVRVWSAGCATGEEAYSVAILLAEHSASRIDGPGVQVFATDLDEAALARAREGVYTDAEVADISPERQQRFFQRERRGHRVRRELREMVLFTRHNVMRDAPFSRLDLIACRNLLIYLNKPAQDRLIQTFHFSLRPGGFLFLGTSESADGDLDLFRLLDKNSHVFESRTVSPRPLLPIADRSLSSTPALHRVPEPELPPERISSGELHLRLLEAYGPPSFVVNEDHVLIHASPQATRFLQMPPGEPSRDILRVVIPELRADLRTALYLAAQERTPVEIGGVTLANPAEKQQLTIQVKPSLRDDDPHRGYFLVLLREDAQLAPQDAGDPSLHLRSPAEPESRRLEDELQYLKSQLRLTIEKYETQAEEARAANEELQAINEELRSAAEELETSKEELQSLNEELTTVNQELKIKIDELGLTNNDFQNLINSTDIGTIFLDRLLRVKLYTPSAQEIFNLLPTDVGRKLSDITSRLQFDRLQDDIVQVLDTLQTVERQVETREGRQFIMRVLPYRTLDDRIDGVSLTFHDVTDWRLAELRVRASEERLRFLVEKALDYAIFTMKDDGRIDSWNPGAERMFGYRADEINGQDAAVLFTPEDREQGVPQHEFETARMTGRASDERWHIRKDGTRLYCNGVMTRLGEGVNVGFAKIVRDLTSQREAQTTLQRSHDQLEVRVGERTAELQAEAGRRANALEHVTLLRALVTAQEDERARIARDLHDQLGQQITALRLALERHRESHPVGGQAEDLDKALALARSIDSEVDFLAWELRPAALDDLGLAAVLPRFLNEWSAHYGVRMNFQTTGTVPPRLSPEAETTFYRITQEALTNVVKHARATRVDVVLEGQRAIVTLVIEDDGIGFEPSAVDKATGIGLLGMHERAALIGATVQVESATGRGTTIYLRYPVVGSTPGGE
ncbi:MAG: CheR family methyltransferase [Vicinamibacterales bacterium]